MRFLGLKWFRTHVGPRETSLYVLNLVSNSPIYLTFYAFPVFLVYLQNSSAYSQYTNRFIPRILSIRTDSFCVWRQYTQQNLMQRFTSFRLVSMYVQIHSTYCIYVNMNRFILHILSIHRDSFSTFGKCAK
jgi:hypothetical protein